MTPVTPTWNGGHARSFFLAAGEGTVNKPPMRPHRITVFITVYVFTVSM
jgi:hypothetical protein